MTNGEKVPSAAAIAGHPIHPMLVPLPIGLLAGAFGADLAYMQTRDPFWARAAHVLTGAGTATALLAAPFGAIDFLARGRVRRHPESWLHGVGNLAAVGLSALSWQIRNRDVERAVVPTGLALSAVTGAILLVTGWLGGELSYRHGIGMIERRSEQATTWPG